jgi:predicted ATPase
MLTRIYIDNYRCFVNFEFRPQPTQLILGLNGTGKSAFLEVLGRLRDFVIVKPGYRAEDLFTSETLTSWQTLPRQTFEFEVTGNRGTYSYTLWADVQEDQPRARVVKEALDFDGKPLVLFQEDQVQLFDDDHLQTANYPFDPVRSALALIGPRKATSKLTWFKEWLERLYCLRFNPSDIGAEAKGEEGEYPGDDLSNFAAWYGHIIQEQTGAFLNFQRSLGETLEGFDSLDLKRAGRTARILRAAFSKPSGDDQSAPKKQRLEFDFDELSDGQRALIALYTLLHCAVLPDTTICIDEPDNYLALAEIQPWLFALSDRIDDEGGQDILISHHPELIDLLAPQHGVLFSRTGLGPVRVEPFRPDALGILHPSEQIARGWERD